MTKEKTVTITVELTDEEAWQWAQFYKRSSFDIYYELSEAGPQRDIGSGPYADPFRTNQAYAMIHAGGKIAAALAEKGYAPR